MDSVNVARDPTDCGLLNDVRSSSPTFVAALKSPPGLLRNTRSGAGTVTPDPFSMAMAKAPESVVASKLRMVGGGRTSLLNELYRRCIIELRDWGVPVDRPLPCIRNVPPLSGGCFTRRRLVDNDGLGKSSDMRLL